jgi:hypothetical protein
MIIRHFQIIIMLLIAASAFAISKQYNPSIILEPSFNKQAYMQLDRIQTSVDTPHLFATIDSLKVGSKYLINVKSNGCFHHSELYLTILRNETDYFASFKMNGKIEGEKVKTRLKKVKLTKTQLDYLRTFEKQLIRISNQTFDCTTTDTYFLIIGSTKNILKTDNCNWNGIGKLIGVLFKRSDN